MGGPSIDAGAPCNGDSRILRYTPPVPEFEVIMLTCNPGEKVEFQNPGVPAVLIILEGSGTLDGELVRPGRTYYAPADASSLVFAVNETRRGPLKAAIAHKNCHLESPTAIDRHGVSQAGSRMSYSGSPMPYLGIGTIQHININASNIEPPSIA
mmetsp:Transcript_13988/g.20160  ORF Transcript_13988/g.20160 Transcript_13988/m.20160 type:complete len:154 (+) Transcript_13988:2-463(+)